MLLSKIITELKDIVGKENVISEKEKMINYSHDEFSLRNYDVFPEIVIKPFKTEQVSKILKLANQKKISITVRGAGTGLCCGCIPNFNSILLSLENMTKFKLDEKNVMLEAEAGVRLKDIQEIVKTSKFFFPPQPGDQNATIGGMISTNAGGTKAVKYGTIRNFVKGLEVVWANGEISILGGKIIKNSTGYNLLHLLIGAEGTLGIITKAIINLLPCSSASLTLIIPYHNLQKAIETVPEIIKSGFLPLSIEFIEKDVLEIARTLQNKHWPTKDGEADLVIILDGTNQENLLEISEKISHICFSKEAIDVFIIENKKKQDEILEIRKSLYELLKPYLVETLDISLPLAEISEHLKKVHQIEKELDVWLPTYGHAADGNVHTHLMKSKFINGKWIEIKNWKNKCETIKEILFLDAKKRGGMLSGEHGIGLIKKKYLPIFLDEIQINFMKEIKKIFDPNNILNSGKIIDL
ncbi:MAG: FAD-binding oxidoreductase [bacterium]